MDCVICGNWFSGVFHDGTCPICSRAIKQLGLNMTPGRLLELAQAEKDGRLVVPPVKIGDKIYRLFDGEIQNLLVSNVIYRAVGGYTCRILVECIPFHRCYWREEFGKTVFLTREEAEAALKSGGGTSESSDSARR